MQIKFVRRIKEDELIEVLIIAYMKQCLSGGNVEYVTGSANTLGFIIGWLGIDPAIVPTEAKKKKGRRKGKDGGGA